MVDRPPPWASLSAEERRITVANVRACCARLPPPGRHFYHEAAEIRPAAGLVPVVDIGGEAALIVTKRPDTMLHHKSDWVFPGGRIDPGIDTNPMEAALREAEEELGIAPQNIEIIGQLDSHGPFITGFTLEVFVGVVDAGSTLDPHPKEVAEVAIIALSTLMTEGHYWLGGLPPGYDPGPVATATDPRYKAAGLEGTMHHFAVKEGLDNEVLWGTQGTIVFNLLTHLVTSRANR